MVIVQDRDELKWAISRARHEKSSSWGIVALGDLPKETHKTPDNVRLVTPSDLPINYDNLLNLLSDSKSHPFSGTPLSSSSPPLFCLRR